MGVVKRIGETEQHQPQVQMIPNSREVRREDIPLAKLLNSITTEERREHHYREQSLHQIQVQRSDDLGSQDSLRSHQLQEEDEIASLISLLLVVV